VMIMEIQKDARKGGYQLGDFLGAKYAERHLAQSSPGKETTTVSNEGRSTTERVRLLLIERCYSGEKRRLPRRQSLLMIVDI
jgi:hypothetical protein